MPEPVIADLKRPRKPAFCRFLYLVSLTFHLVIWLLLFSGLLNSPWLADMFRFYHPGLNTTMLALVDLAGIVMVSLILTGLVMMRHPKKAGLFLYVCGTMGIMISFSFWVELDLLFLVTETLFIVALSACQFRYLSLAAWRKSVE